MTNEQAKQYIKDFMLIAKPNHMELEKFKLALKIASTIKMPE